jgi:acetyl esterase/lipase
MTIGYELKTRSDILYAVHDGVELLGDLYRPNGIDRAPVLVAVHGGGFQIGDRKFYKHWGPYLARNGYAVFSIEYRLMRPGVKTWPGAVCDTKAAVQFAARTPPISVSTPTALRLSGIPPVPTYRRW